MTSKIFFASRKGRVHHELQVLHLYNGQFYDLKNSLCVASGQSSPQASSPSSIQFLERYQLLSKALQSPSLNTYQFYDFKNFLCFASGQISPETPCSFTRQSQEQNSFQSPELHTIQFYDLNTLILSPCHCIFQKN
jgi:hypothetical protein